MGQSNNNRARMNGYKFVFRLYVAGKMDNRLLCDHLIYHSIDYFQVCIVDLIRVGSNNEHQLEELLSRKEMDLGFRFHNALWPKPGLWILLSKQKVYKSFLDFTSVECHFYLYCYFFTT